MSISQIEQGVLYAPTAETLPTTDLLLGQQGHEEDTGFRYWNGTEWSERPIGVEDTWRRGAVEANYGLDFNSFGAGYPNVNTGYMSLTHGESNSSTGYGTWAIGYSVVLPGQLSFGFGQLIVEDVSGHTASNKGQNIILGSSIDVTDSIEGLYSGTFVEVTGDVMTDDVLQRGRGNVVLSSGYDGTNKLTVTGRHQKVLTTRTAAYTGSGILGAYNAVLGGLDLEIQASTTPATEETRYNVLLGGVDNVVKTDAESCFILAGSGNDIATGVSNSGILGGTGITADEDDTSYAQRMRIEGDGTGSELVMKSPDGTVFTITVTNGGVLTVT